MDSATTTGSTKILRSLDQNKPTPMAFGIVLVVAALVGIGAGFGAARLPKSPTSGGVLKTLSAKKVDGEVDKKKYPDTATGTLKEGGLDGEGSFHLVRPGGDSQNVYLTSSVVDLSKYLGKKIKVGGQTFAGQKAGWLMDVGYVEVQ
jgi:hypothetical protein